MSAANESSIVTNLRSMDITQELQPTLNQGDVSWMRSKRPKISTIRAMIKLGTNTSFASVKQIDVASQMSDTPRSAPPTGL
jgi:hypothetical protein